MNTYLQAKQTELSAAAEHYKKDLATLRTGRANPAILDGVLAEAYGVKSPLNSLGNISVVDARCLTVAPWDKSVLKDIEKAIIEANLGLGVVNEGDKIRLTIPQMTEENRHELVKKANEKMEKAKIAVRQIREEIKKAIDDAEGDKEINEDDKFRFLKELDEAIASRNEEIKEIRDKKEAEIMEI